MQMIKEGRISVKAHRLFLPCLFVLSALICCLAVSCKSSIKNENEIKFVWFGSEEETRVIKEIVADFEAKNPDIKVNIQMVEWMRFNEKLLTMLLGGRAPDISRISVQWCNRYAELEAFTDISDLLLKDELDDFVESRLASCRYNDKLFGLPHSSIGLMMYYNADLLKKAQIEPPASPDKAWTWAEFEQVCMTVKEKTGVKYGWSMFKGWFPLAPFFYQNSGSFFDSALTQTTFASPENIETLKWLVEQHQKGVAPISGWTGGDSGVDLFARGYCTFLIMGNWSLTPFTNRIKDFNWGVTYLPCNKIRASNVGGENIVIFNTKKREKAVRLLTFLASKKNISKFSSRALFIPTRKSLITSDFKYEQHNEYMQKFIGQSKDFQSRWAQEQGTTAFSELEKDFLKNTELAIMKQKTPEEALRSIDLAFANLKK